jgi:hypothetical protein
MGYLFNSFCYSSINNLSSAIQSSKNLNLTYISTDRYSKFLHYYISSYTESASALTATISAQYITSNPSGNVLSSQWLSILEVFSTCNYPGHYIQDMNITLQNPSDNFNPSNLNPVDVLNSIGSGFLLVAVPLAVVWAGRHFLRPLFSK